MKGSSNRGSSHPNWKGGLTLTFEGYVRFTAGPHKWRMEHKVILERKLGRPLHPGYHAHHRNSIPWDNRPSNLVELSHADHNRLCVKLRQDPNHHRITILDMSGEQAEQLTSRGVSIPKHLMECMSWYEESIDNEAPF